MTKIELAKAAVGFVVGAGTSKIAGSIIRNNVSPDKVTDQVAVVSATVVIGMMAADATRKYTDDKIDEAVAWYRINVLKIPADS
jgi:hypothetical protein